MCLVWFLLTYKGNHGSINLELFMVRLSKRKLVAGRKGRKIQVVLCGSKSKGEIKEQNKQ